MLPWVVETSISAKAALAPAANVHEAGVGFVLSALRTQPAGAVAAL
jgi:hypothetical protein